MDAALEAELLKFVSTLDSSENPYAALSAWVSERALPTVPHSAVLQLYVLAAILGATLLLVIISVAIRIRKGIFWLYSLSRSPFFLIKPHFSLTWSCIAVVMLAAFEFCIAQCIDLFRKNLHANLGFTVFLCWTPAWVGGAAAAHALGTGLLIQAMTKSKSTRKLAKWAAVNNIVGIAAPFVYLSIMLPLGIIGGKRFSRLIGTYNEVNAFLRGLAQSWTPGTPINLLELAPALPLVKKVVLQQERLFVSWRQVFLSYAVTVMFLLIVLVTIALLHLTALRRSIKQTRTAFSSNLPSSRARQQVNRTYTTLLATVIAFVSLATVFFAVSVYAALNPASLQQTVPAQVVVLLPMYAFAVFGFPTSALLVWRAVEASSETGTSQTRRSTSSGSKSGSKPGIDKVDLPRYSIELNANRAETDPTSLDLQLAMIDVSVEIEIEEEVESECDRDLNEKLDYAA